MSLLDCIAYFQGSTVTDVIVTYLCIVSVACGTLCYVCSLLYLANVQLLSCRLTITYSKYVIVLLVFCFADIEQMVFVDVRKRELLEARFVNEKVCLL